MNRSTLAADSTLLEQYWQSIRCGILWKCLIQRFFSYNPGL